MDSKVCFTLVAGALCLSACSDFKVEEVPGHYSLVVIEDVDSGDKCPAGGKKIVSGVDMDRSGTLEVSEVTDIKYVCTGIPGNNALVEVVDVAAGKEGCQFGGKKVISGVDTNGNGKLSESEIKDTWVTCSGTIPSVSGRVTKIAASYNQSCALIEDGTVQCWGIDGKGIDLSPVPIKVAGLYGAKDVAVGCALGEDGIVRCWNGMSGSPRAVSDLKDVVAIAGSTYRQMCGLKSDGSLVCWGENTAGELGNGSFVSSATPVSVVDENGMRLTNVKKVVIGSRHTCAIMEDTTMKCWGWNEYGQLGLGDEGQNFHSRAMSVLDKNGGKLSQVVDAGAGYAHTCALLMDGEVKCWGINEVGQLGTGTTEGISKVPVMISLDETGNAKATSIAGGYGHTCVTVEEGGVKCWGWNVYGQLGDESVERMSAKPVSVSGITGATELVLGEAHSCAMLGSAGIKCWGNNLHGQFGNGVEAVNQGYDIKSKKVVELENVTSISAGYLFNCAKFPASDSTEVGAQQVKCWGNNDYGQLGINMYGTIQRFPMSVLSNGEGEILKNVSDQPGDLVTGYVHACVKLMNGEVRCWGDNSQFQMGVELKNDATAATNEPAAVLPVKIPNVTDPDILAAGHAHTCAHVTEAGVGKVKCWGYNEFGQLGNGSTENSTPSSIEKLQDVQIIGLSLGRTHSCALDGDGSAWCWGSNAAGQLGVTLDEGINYSVEPLQVSGTGVLKQLAAGHAHTCALDGAGGIICWGSNLYGESGEIISGDKPFVGITQVKLSGVGVVAEKVVSGYMHNCALTSDMKVQCWGSNSYGQLGNEVLTGSNTPVEISGLEGVIDLAVGYQHTCALTNDGNVHCWGGDQYGQLGRVNGNPVPTEAVFVK